MLNIIEYDIPDDEGGPNNYYIVLESISSNTSKVIHVVSMRTISRLVIGRGHEAHVRVTDISVSRMHAFLLKSNAGYYYLTDNNSKFGTLSLVKTPLEIEEDSRTTLQIGRTIFDLELSGQRRSHFCDCFGHKKPPKKTKEERSNDKLISIDGVNLYPHCFSSLEYLQQMSKRRMSGMRRLTRVSTKLGIKDVKPEASANAQLSPHGTVHIPTGQNQEEDEVVDQVHSPSPQHRL